MSSSVLPGNKHLSERLSETLHFLITRGELATVHPGRTMRRLRLRAAV